MEEKRETDAITYIYDGVMARLERTVKRLWILCIILIALCAFSNYAWIKYEQSFEDVVTTEVSQDAEWDSGNVIMNGTGEVNTNGESKADSNDSQSTSQEGQ